MSWCVSVYFHYLSHYPLEAKEEAKNILYTSYNLNIYKKNIPIIMLSTRLLTQRIRTIYFISFRNYLNGTLLYVLHSKRVFTMIKQVLKIFQIAKA